MLARDKRCLEVPKWIELLLERFFDNHSMVFDRRDFTQQFARVDVENYGCLEVDFLVTDESLLFSLRSKVGKSKRIISRLLELNHYNHQRPFSPTAHMYNSDIVFRVVLSREQIELVNVESVFNRLMHANQKATEG